MNRLSLDTVTRRFSLIVIFFLLFQLKSIVENATADADSHLDSHEMELILEALRSVIDWLKI